MSRIALFLAAALLSTAANAAYPWQNGTDDPDVPNCYIGFSEDHPGSACENPDFDWSIYCVTIESKVVDPITWEVSYVSRKVC